MAGGLPTERQAQRAIIAMINRHFPSVITHHSPNGAHYAGGAASRFKQVGALKGDGMKVGFPDLVCIWNHGVAFMEVKRPKYVPSQVSEAQTKMHHDLAERGYPVRIVTCPEEAMQFLIERGAPLEGMAA